MITVFLDETGSFRPCAAGQHDLAAVFGVIVPDVHSDALQKDFAAFVSGLPRSAFVNGEPKGSRLSLDRQKSLAAMLNAHRGVMTVPVTVNREMGIPAFDLWPQKLKAILEKQAGKCIHETMQQHVDTLAKRCGNLSAEQIARLSHS